MNLTWMSKRGPRLRERAFLAARDAADQARDRRDWKAAASHYAEALEIDPGADNLAVQLGHAYKEMGDYSAAAMQYYSVIDRNPNDDDLCLQIGHLEKLRNNYVTSHEYYRRAVDLNPNNKDAYLELKAAEANFCLTGAAEWAPEDRSLVSEPSPPEEVGQESIAVTTSVLQPTNRDVSYFLFRRPCDDGVLPPQPEAHEFLARAKLIESRLAQSAAAP